MGCGPSDAEFSIYETYHSPEGSISIIIKTAPSHKFAYAPEILQFYLEDKTKKNSTLLLFKTKIANDGGRLGPSNIQASWIDQNKLRLCLSGVEQNDIVVEINAEDLSYSERTGKCK